MANLLISEVSSLCAIHGWDWVEGQIVAVLAEERRSYPITRDTKCCYCGTDIMEKQGACTPISIEVEAGCSRRDGDSRWGYELWHQSCADADAAKWKAEMIADGAIIEDLPGGGFSVRYPQKG